MPRFETVPCIYKPCSVERGFLFLPRLDLTLMPGFAPRTEPIKKEEELSKRENELRHALQKNVATEKLDTQQKNTGKRRLLCSKQHSM